MEAHQLISEVPNCWSITAECTTSIWTSRKGHHRCINTDEVPLLELQGLPTISVLLVGRLLDVRSVESGRRVMHVERWLLGVVSWLQPVES